MAGKDSSSNIELLQELEALSQTLYQSHTARRTNSLILPRSATPNQGNPPSSQIGHSDKYVPVVDIESRFENRPRSRRMSMSPWRSRPSKKSEFNNHVDQQQQQENKEEEEEEEDNDFRQVRHRRGSNLVTQPVSSSNSKAVVEEKKGIWNWKPMRALSHIAMQRMGCLFSVDVVGIQGLPASMNGLRLSVSVRKKETKDGTVQTMPARVLQGAADFEETMFIRCHVYCTGGSGTGKTIKFEQRPFFISVIAIDALELDFGKYTVDLSVLMKESMEKSLDGERIRHWDRRFKLSGKAKGGELVVKLGFQIMEDGGVALYSQQDSKRTPMKNKGSESPSSYARKQSKSSFSISSPRTPGKMESVTTPSKSTAAVDYKDIDDFKLDEPAPPAPARPHILVETKGEDDHEFPEFEVLDKGIEVEDGHKKNNSVKEEEEEEAKSVSSEAVVVTEVVTQDPVHQMRLSELDSIANQIKVLESMVLGSDAQKYPSVQESNVLDANEENLTRELLNLLELEDSRSSSNNNNSNLDVKLEESVDEPPDNKCFVSDLGKGLGPVIQTKDGGFLASVNPFDVEVSRKETPVLAIQISKPLVLTDQKKSSTGFELFQRMAAFGPLSFESKLMSVSLMDELAGKTAEQIAFEGIASEIISGRNKHEGANSSGAKLVAALKTMSTSLSYGRKERTLTGIWNAGEEPVLAEELLSFSLQKIESMAVEALKVQADMAEEEAPFDVLPINVVGKDANLGSTVTMEEWRKDTRSRGGVGSEVTVMMVIQTRDPLRRYEKVGGPIVALVQAVGVGEGKYKVGSVHAGGMKGRGGGGGGGEKKDNALTATQWLNGCGFGGKKRGKPTTPTSAGGGGRGLGNELVWSLSSRIMADMWLKPIRNPDVKFHN